MTVPDRRRVRTGGHGCGSDAGSTLPELVVASGLVLLVLVLLTGSVLPALGMLGAAAEPDPVLQRLDLAADTIARAVRRAGPGPDGTVLHLEGPELHLHLGAAAVGERLVLRIADGVLTMTEVTSDPAAASPELIVVEGLDEEESRFLVVPDPMPVPPSTASAAAIRIELAAEGRRVTRFVRLRVPR